MNLSESKSQTNLTETSEQTSEVEADVTISANAMDEYYQLKKSIFLVAIASTVIISVIVCLTYSATTAASYFVGSCVGIIYLRMLAKDVEKVSGDNARVSSGRLALFAGMIIIAAKWEQLELLPVFLGFLTYKISIILSILPNSSFAVEKSD
ncbi:MAG: ATP synthase subunit I [Limnothrix sp.]